MKCVNPDVLFAVNIIISEPDETILEHHEQMVS
jgi:hypothetical protein